MSLIASPLVFGLAWLLATATVLLLPVLPALRELFSRSDAGALEIDHLDDGHTAYDAQSALKRLPLLEEMPRIAQWQHDDRGRLLVPRGQGRLSVKTQNSLVLGFRAEVTTLVCAETVELQANSMVKHILHGKHIHCLGPVFLARKTSAVRNIVLAPGVHFQRLAANCVFTWPLKRHIGFPIDGLGEGMPLTVVQRRHHGDLHLRAGSLAQGGLVITGNLHMDDGAVVVGHIKVHGNVAMGAGACIKGALFALGSIRTAGNNYIEGPLSAGHSLRLGINSQVGNKQVRSSASAWTIQLEASVRVYGSLSAVRMGEVML
ncbi:MAG: hypothetical protein RSD57_03875 [Comamonas sp.]